ncbi:MAG TPA: MarR family transcriptional regulator [Nocardioides sp.]|nr:MarR family transcriptional regulator [Nocardioides sp.]
MPPHEPDAHPPRREPDTGDLVMTLARRVRRAYAEALAEWHVTPSQSRALRVLAGSPGGMRPSVLAEELRIAPRSATEVADALVGRGWVQRAGDPTDRRATRLTLTDSGRDLVARIDDVRREASEQVLDVLPAAQRRTLHEILLVVVGEDQ